MTRVDEDLPFWELITPSEVVFGVEAGASAAALLKAFPDLP